MAKPFQSLLARAIFHNDAEAPNELCFRKGEILTVLNRSPEGLGGWWICNVRGKIGLAPGNRLQLLGVVQVSCWRCQSLLICWFCAH